MADEQKATETAAEPANANPASANAPAEAKNTDNAEHMIPKARFDEVNKKLRDLEKQAEQAAKASSEAEQKRLAEEGKYKELFERQQAELAKAQAEAKNATLTMLRREAAAKVGIPARLADRLQGETAEELEADAKAILADLPKPAAPNINSQPGPGGAPRPGTPTDAEIVEKAARLGVKPDLMKQGYARQ